MTDPAELEDLGALIESPGYKRLLSLFEAQWGRSGQRYCDVLEKLLNSNADRAALADDLQRVTWVRKEMEQFFRTIEGRVTELKNQRVPVANSSRRGLL